MEERLRWGQEVRSLAFWESRGGEVEETVQEALEWKAHDFEGGQRGSETPADCCPHLERCKYDSTSWSCSPLLPEHTGNLVSLPQKRQPYKHVKTNFCFFGWAKVSGLYAQWLVSVGRSKVLCESKEQ